MEEKEEKERYSYRDIRRFLVMISIYYKWPFWRLIEEDGVYSLKSRVWVHWLRDILMMPFWLIAGFCSGIVMIFQATAYEKKLTWNGKEKPDKEAKRYIKKRLLS